MHILFLEPFLTPILFIVITVVLAIGFFVLWSIYRKEEKFEEKREAEFGNYEKVLTEAHTKAEQILQSAADNATKLSTEGTEFTKQLDEQTQQALKDVVNKNLTMFHQSSQEFLTAYQASLQGLKSSYEQEIEAMLQKIKQDSLAEITALQQTIRQKTIDAQGGLSKQLDDEFAKTQIEIHEYKKRKMEDVTLRMDKFIMKVSEEVLGQAISLSQQQQLITQALEKAQKEGMFEM